MKIVFFDFDGTITSKDSLFIFLKYVFGKIFYWKMLFFLPTYLRYLVGHITNQEAKEILFSMFFYNISKVEFDDICEKFVNNNLKDVLKNDALEKIQSHIVNKDKVVIVSASISNYLTPLAKQLNVELISTELEFKEGIFTGRFSTKNCYGPEKVNRILERYNLTKYDEILAYGDSKGDREMLEIATKKFYKVFKK
jgi:HAD superfamily hydrolase (TIGR01490 family)